MNPTVKLAGCQVDYLNLVRALAAQAVLFGHATIFYLYSYDRSGRVEIAGVLVFFLISGFLITSSVLQKWDRTDYGFGDYFADRFCRIFTAYVPALLFVAAADAMLRDHPAYPFPNAVGLGTWLGNLLMLQDFPVFQVLRRLGVADPPGFVDMYGSGRPFWTVAIEWWIYLFFGYLTFQVLRRRRFRPIDAAILAVLAIVPAYNAMGGVGQCLTLVWAVGATVALIQNRLAQQAAAWQERGWARRGLVYAALTVGLCAVLLAGRAAANGFRIYDLQFALFSAGVLFGIFFMLGFRPIVLPARLRAAIAWFADYSYSLYLIHYTVLVGLSLYWPRVAPDSPRQYLAACLLSNLVGILVYYLFERHHGALATRLKAAMRRERESGRDWLRRKAL